MMIKAWRLGGRVVVEVHKTSCIVQWPPGGSAEFLVNSANERLEGCRRPYVPRGGPLPALGPTGERSDAWGGLEIGAGMVYRSQSVDGVVDLMGGRSLARERSRVLQERGLLAPGDAVLTPATERLLENKYRFVVHAVAPYWKAPAWAPRLTAAYEAALALCATSAAIPLLGAGARGAPIEEAAAIAARAVLDHSYIGRPKVLRFACLEHDTAHLLSRAFDDHFLLHSNNSTTTTT